jgi:hypothetical protein
MSGLYPWQLLSSGAYATICHTQYRGGLGGGGGGGAVGEGAAATPGT